MNWEHRHWCQTCRKVRNVESNVTPEVAKAKLELCHCQSMATYLESVPSTTAVAARSANDQQQDSNLQKPPSAQEWYDNGYAPGTYRHRFANDAAWSAPWSDPDYVPKRRKPEEIVECMAADNATDETEQAPAVETDTED